MVGNFNKILRISFELVSSKELYVDTHQYDSVPNHVRTCNVSLKNWQAEKCPLFVYMLAHENQCVTLAAKKLNCNISFNLTSKVPPPPNSLLTSLLGMLVCLMSYAPVWLASSIITSNSVLSIFDFASGNLWRLTFSLRLQGHFDHSTVTVQLAREMHVQTNVIWGCGSIGIDGLIIPLQRFGYCVRKHQWTRNIYDKGIYSSFRYTEWE